MSAKDQKNISVEEVESDEDMPGLEEAPKTTDTPTTGGKQNRAEKKARRAIGKLNMKPVPGITRVTVKKAKNILFVIGQPEVFQADIPGTYVIFGEAKIEDINSQAVESAAQQFQEGDDMPDLGEDMPGLVDDADEDEEVDESGLDSDEITTIVSQVACSRGKAVKALRKHGNIVDAILELNP